ncbi:MAG: hypothetical protein R3349_00205 [Geminicoccaceae bacterium]|nr:hypothetical protein [Geminicoccaceae bacterium]
MTIERDSIHFQILERLCAAPRPVRGASGAILERDYNAPRALQELKAQGLIKERGWHDGPGSIFVPTEEGEALYAKLVDTAAKPLSPRWVKR